MIQTAYFTFSQPVVFHKPKNVPFQTPTLQQNPRQYPAQPIISGPQGLEQANPNPYRTPPSPQVALYTPQGQNTQHRPVFLVSGSPRQQPQVYEPNNVQGPQVNQPRSQYFNGPAPSTVTSYPSPDAITRNPYDQDEGYHKQSYSSGPNGMS